MSDVVDIITSNPIISWYDKIFKIKQLIDDGEDVDSYIQEEIEIILALFCDCLTMGFDCKDKENQETIEVVMYMVEKSSPQRYNFC